MQLDSTTYRLTDSGRFGTIALAIGIVGVLASAVGYFTDADQLFHSWLVAFTFWATIGIGGLFMTMVHHLTGAMWSVVVRRIGEAIMSALPWMLLFGIPVAIGMGSIYIWTDADYMHTSATLTSKMAYLNPTFFVVRLVIYFAVWALLAALLNKASLAQDDGWQEGAQKRFLTISGPGMIAFALTVTFASFDWIMSMEPYWYSTIYGLWFFAGGITSVMAMYALVVDGLHSKNVLTGTITQEHQHDIGKLLFAFLVFWGYMHLSQYLLIWYANLPEETLFYKMRWGAGWTWMSALLVIGGFVIPFLWLIGRSAKRNRASRMVFAVWLLFIHWVDLYWNIMPNFHEETVKLSWMDLTTLMAVGGFFLFFFWRHFTRHPVIPVTDPKLEESLQHVNY